MKRLCPQEARVAQRFRETVSRDVRTGSESEHMGRTRQETETAYAWSDADGNFTAVLGVPPATDPRIAVKVSIGAAAKKGKHN